uniref:Uncharacterized protein n=1 Tax=Cacopsylla melanoneura TaxID=428564 RepID=A0A8D8X0G9_9HEMI
MTRNKPRWILNSSRLNFNQIKFQNHIFRFRSTSSTRDQSTLWECAVDNCPAHVKLNKDNSKIIKSNDKHKHSNSGPGGEHRRSDAASTSDSSQNSSPSLSRMNSLNETSVPVAKQADPNNSTETVVAASTFDSENLLPDNQSILSMGTPATDISTNTFNGNNSTSIFSATPLVRDQTKDLRFQIHSLTQEIINKQIQIDNLNEKAEQDREELERIKNKAEFDEAELKRLRFKSEEDDKIIKEMIESIRTLEGLPDKKNSNTKLKNGPTTTKQKKMSSEKCQTVISPRCAIPPRAPREVQFSNTNKSISTPTTEARTTRLVVFGDSHVRNLKNHLEKELPGSYQIHTHFKPGGTFQAIANSISSNDLKYEKVFVMAGTNDVCHSSWTEIENAVIEISTMFKDRTVFLVVVPQRGENCIMNKYVNIFNKNLKLLARRLCNVECIEINHIFDYQDFCGDKLVDQNNQRFTLVCRH